MYDEKKAEKRADRVVNFIGTLEHSVGKWAGKPFILAPWQETIIRENYSKRVC